MALSANSYLAQGESRLLKGDLKGLDLFEKAIELDPCNPELFYRQGLALFEYGSEEGKEKALFWASKKFKTALHLAPLYQEAWHVWGNTLFELGIKTNELHYFTEAEEKLKKAVELNNLDSELYWDYAKVWTEIGNHSGEAIDYQMALNAFQKSTAIQEGLPEEFWSDFGNAALEMENLVNDHRLILQAIDCYKHAVPSFEGWHMLARSMHRLFHYTHDADHFTEAHECYCAASQLKPDSSELWQEWAAFLLETGRKTRDPKKIRASLEKCQHGAILDPQSVQLLATGAEALAFLGELSDKIDLLYEAQNKFNELLQLSDESDPDVWHAHGKLLSSWGAYFDDFEYYYQAIEKFQESLSIDRTRHQDWFAIANTYAKVGRILGDIDAFEKAARFYSKAIDLKPTSLYYFEYALALSHLGEMKRDHRLIKQSLRCFEYTFQVQKNVLYTRPEWLYHYAMTLDLAGDYEEDEASYEKAVEIYAQIALLDPDFPRIHFRMGLVYSHLGEARGQLDLFHLAIHHFKLALKNDEDESSVILNWGTTLISIAEHTLDEDIAENCFREAELKLTDASRMGNEEAYYQLACLYSLQKQFDKALFFLEKSHESKSLPPIDEILNDDWLDGLRLTTPFQEFLAHLQHG